MRFDRQSVATQRVDYRNPTRGSDYEYRLSGKTGEDIEDAGDAVQDATN